MAPEEPVQNTWLVDAGSATKAVIFVLRRMGRPAAFFVFLARRSCSESAWLHHITRAR